MKLRVGLIAAAYIAIGSLTFGVVWNETHTACLADQKIKEWRYCDGVNAGMGAVVAGAFWPITWPARIGVEITRTALTQGEGMKR